MSHIKKMQTKCATQKKRTFDNYTYKASGSYTTLNDAMKCAETLNVLGSTVKIVHVKNRRNVEDCEYRVYYRFIHTLKSDTINDHKSNGFVKYNDQMPMYKPTKSTFEQVFDY